MGLRLRGVVGGLVKVVIGQGSVLLAEFLCALVRKHLGPKLTAVTFWDADRGDDACGEEGRSISRSMPSAMSLRPRSSLRTRTVTRGSLLRCFDSQVSNGAFAYIPAHVR
jgi:hypothetical protein